MNCGLVAIVIATVICSSLASTDVIVRFKISLDAMESFEGQPRHHIRAALGNHATNAQIRAISLVENYSLDYQSFWLDNSLAVTQAPPALIEALEALEEVASVTEDAQVYLPSMNNRNSQDEKSRDVAGKASCLADDTICFQGSPFVCCSGTCSDTTPGRCVQSDSTAEHTPANEEEAATKPQGNINTLNTGKLWDAGFTGQGVVVATIDSGVRWTHEALRSNYRGFQANPNKVDHDYSMWTVNSTVVTPDNVDIYGHGTHVTGTLAGAGSTHIGMAPNATWIHARAFNWLGATSQSTLIAAAQWVLCPTKFDHTSEDCSKGAHVISCSFGGNSSLTWLNPSVKAMRAAGAVPVFASGNVNAFKCGSVMEPGGSDDAIAVGGVNSGVLYPSSGKGPGLDGKTIKPDFVAPSFGIRSSISAADSGHDAYSRLTGTSMATPHVAGALALLMSTGKAGSNSSSLVEALRDTGVQNQRKPIFAASKCGGTPYNTYPNNIYGWGLPDVCAAAKKIGVQCS